MLNYKKMDKNDPEFKKYIQCTKKVFNHVKYKEKGNYKAIYEKGEEGGTIYIDKNNNILFLKLKNFLFHENFDNNGYYIHYDILRKYYK